MAQSSRTDRGSVLVLYHRPAWRWFRDASTIVEQVAAFIRHSRFAVRALNTDLGFPARLRNLDVGAVVMHYSLFGAAPYKLGDPFLEWLDRSTAYKVCFFSDEHAHCRVRRTFIDDHQIDCVYSHVEPGCADEVYGRCSRPPLVEFNIPGYVTEEVRSAAARYARPDAERRIDVGYRGRVLPAWMGAGAQEKATIGTEFARRAAGRGLALDIDVAEGARLYGDDWHCFLGDCRCTLGVESGTSYMDLEDEVLAEHLAREAAGTGTADDPPMALARWEGNISYRTIATRHFEAAAFHSCQTLFEGRYSGVMEPMVHYLPLRKDFSNLEEILRLQTDADIRREITGTAHRDLIGSGRYDAARLVAAVDRTLADAGVVATGKGAAWLDMALAGHVRRRRVLVEARHLAAIAGAKVYRRTPEPVLRALRAATR